LKSPIAFQRSETTTLRFFEPVIIDARRIMRPIVKPPN
jgi:hypothetical protein